MQPDIGWHDVTIRLFWTVIGGGLIGLNREEHGRAAGLRTTLLLCLAASFAMILANFLLSTSGKTPEMFATIDVMRLPLGILSGMGFIGAGAIVRRDNLVAGVTTAATLWFVTVMGLCFGGGQIVLGLVALALGLGVLAGLKWTERVCKQERSAILTIVPGPFAVSENEMVQRFGARGYRLRVTSTSLGEDGKIREMNCEILWRGRLEDNDLPIFLQEFARRFSLLQLRWQNIAAH